MKGTFVRLTTSRGSVVGAVARRRMVEEMADKMSPLLVARYMAIIQNMTTIAGGNADDWKVLRELCSDVVALRKGDHNAERLKIERERLRWS